MKKLLSLIIMALSFQTIAGFSPYSVKELNIDFSETSGTIKLDQLVIPMLPLRINNPVTFDLIKSDENLIVRYNELDLVIEQMTEELKNLRATRLKSLNLSIEEKKARLTIPSAFINQGSKSTALRGLNLNCAGNYTAEDTIKNILLTECTKNGKFSLSSINSLGAKDTTSILDRIFDREPDPNSRGAITMESLNFSASNNFFGLSVKIKADTTIKLKASGRIHFDKVANKIVIKIDKAKVGIFSIRSKLFKELKKEESPTFRVNKPFLTILLPKKK